MVEGNITNMFKRHSTKNIMEKSIRFMMTDPKLSESLLQLKEEFNHRFSVKLPKTKDFDELQMGSDDFIRFVAENRDKLRPNIVSPVKQQTNVREQLRILIKTPPKPKEKKSTGKLNSPARSDESPTKYALAIEKNFAN